jgi:hypothetical protein
MAPDTLPPIYMALPEDGEVLAEIGRVAIRHGQLDNVLRLTLGDLVGTERSVTLDATARTGSAALRKRIHDLAKKRLGDGEALVRLEAILAHAEQATERRNEILHSVWGREMSGEAVVRDDKHTFGSAPSVDNLKQVTADILKVIDELLAARFGGFLKKALEAKKKS